MDSKMKKIQEILLEIQKKKNNDISSGADGLSQPSQSQFFVVTDIIIP